MSGRTIAHLDMDAFYVAVELLRHPELRGRPVIVAGTGPRAVVTTASYEARPFGVGSAIPVATAKRRCPELVHLPVDMAHYRERSAEVMALVAELGVPAEPVSLDETYLDLTSLPDPVARMSALVRRIRAETELDASVGIGPNKLVAKVASDAEKPRGFVVLTREQAVERFAAAPVTLIPGIGPKTADRLRRYGVTRLGQLQRCTVPGLIERFGPTHGRALHDRAHFRSADPVTSERAAKSRSVETTFDRDIADRGELERILSEQSDRLAKLLRDRDLAGRTIAIKVRLDDWTTVTRARTIEAPTNDPATIAAEARALLRAYAPPRPVRLLGVRVSSFEGRGSERRPEPEAMPSLLGEAV
ncbi:MAG TPA: DNA polymerase IV [Solirubrobacterales bacterium]|nr:DNA polymerase IV [Solirubrobacterales bacterium]